LRYINGVKITTYYQKWYSAVSKKESVTKKPTSTHVLNVNVCINVCTVCVV